MSKVYSYYLGRLIKRGILNTEKIYNAIKSPKPYHYKDMGWSFFDAEENENDGVPYITGRLSKYNPNAEVVISDPVAKIENTQPEPNLRIASSHFVYIPSMAGIAFSRASQHIEEYKFNQYFSSVVKHKYEDFFVDCEIKMIADLKTFAQKLSAVEKIYKISANLNPPNPLYGSLWKGLSDYIKSRGSDKMLIREESSDRQPLKTNLPEIVDEVSKQTKDKKYHSKEKLPIGDAAILMAADGYGNGHIKGLKDGVIVIIKTSAINKCFSFDKEPTNAELFKEAYLMLKEIEDERHLEH